MNLVGRFGFLTKIIFVLLIPGLAGAEVNVLGFQAWKTSRVDEARLNLEKVQADRPQPAALSAGKTAKPSEMPTPSRLQALSKNSRGDAKAQQAQVNLELAQELTVNDYFVLYVSQLKGREAFVEAAKKLTPEEAADLMMAYLKHLRGGGATFDDLPPPSAAGLASPAAASNKAISN